MFTSLLAGLATGVLIVFGLVVTGIVLFFAAWMASGSH